MAISYDNATSISALGVSSLETASWTISGSDRLLIGAIGFSAASPPSLTAAKWGGSGGVDLSILDADSSAFSFAGMGYLVAPSTGSSTLYVSLSGSADEFTLGAVSYTGVDQDTPLGTPVSDAPGTVTSLSVNVSSGADEVVFGMAFASGPSNTEIIPGASQTERFDEVDIGGFSDLCGSEEPGDTTVTHSYSWTNSSNYGAIIIAVSIKPAPVYVATGTSGGWVVGSATSFVGEAFVGSIEAAASGAISGVCALVFDDGTSVLTGGGALAGSAALVFDDGTSVLLGAGALTGSAALVFDDGTSVLLGAGALAGSAALVFDDGTSVLLGAGTLIGSAALVFDDGTSVLLGAGALTGAAAMAFTATVTPAQDLAGNVTLTMSASAVLTGTGALAGSAALVFDDGTSVLLGAGALAGSAALVFDDGTSVLTGAGALAGSAALVFDDGTSVLLGAGALAGSAAMTITPTAALAGVGLLAGTSTITITPTGALPGSGALLGSAAMVFGAGSTALLGAGALTGSAAMVLTATLTAGGSISSEAARRYIDSYMQAFMS